MKEKGLAPNSKATLVDLFFKLVKQPIKVVVSEVPTVYSYRKVQKRTPTGAEYEG